MGGGGGGGGGATISFKVLHQFIYSVITYHTHSDCKLVSPVNVPVKSWSGLWPDKSLHREAVKFQSIYPGA